MNRNTVRLLLVDDAAVVRKAIRGLLAEEPSIEVVGEAEDFRQAIGMAAQLKPDIILLDLHMGDTPALEPEFIKSRFSDCGSKVLAMSLYSEEDDESRILARRLGAIAMLDKTDLYNGLIPAIKNSSHRDNRACRQSAAPPTRRVVEQA